jgi:hypothetical protein
MPCWQTNTLTYETIKLDQPLLEATIRELRKHPEFIAGGYTIHEDIEELIVTLPPPYDWSALRINLFTGTLTYDQQKIAVKNLFKRVMSTEAVKIVANKSRIKRKFKLTQTAEREFLMRRK